MTGERRALLVTSLLLAAIALLAVTSPGLDWEPINSSSSSERPSEDRPQPQTGQGEPEDRVTTPLPEVPEERAGWRLTLVGLFTLLALLGATVFTVALLARLRLTLRRRQLSARLGLRSPGQLPEEEQILDSDELVAALEAGLDTLETGTPRNAVVAAWVGLERAAEAAGTFRDPSDTATDLARRMLVAYPVDRETLERLAELYREARFSRHPLSEGHRERARACLERLRREILTGVRP